MLHKFLLNNLSNSDVLQSQLVATGIDENDIHFVSENSADFAGHHIHEASIFEERDLIHSSIRTATLGAAVGAVVNIGIYFIQPYGWQIELINVVLLMLLFIGFGGWIGGMIGISSRNYRLSKHEVDLKRGKAIMLVYTDDEHADKAKQIVTKTESGGRYLGKDSAIDNPLKNEKIEELEH
ncbi:MAG: hypothetical protein ACFHVJ_12240 [Aestuariibacter sp.]